MTDAMFDPELQELLGKCRCTDDSDKPKEIQPCKGTPQKGKEIYSPWKPTFFERVKMCSRTIVPLVIAQTVVYIWQYCGMLDKPAAFPALWVMAILTGFCAGKYIK